MSLQDRVTEAILGCQKRPTGVAAEIGISTSAMSQLMNGPTKKMKAETALGLELATGYRASWLIHGKGPKLVNTNVERGPTRTGDVPLIDWITAGTWEPATDALPPGAAERWLPCVVRHSDQTFALTVRGDSMTAPYGRSYPEGCIIYVDPELRSPVNGQRIVARMDHTHNVTFKVFKEEDGRRWLQPLNPSHLPLTEPFHVVGAVIGTWTDENEALR